MDFSRYGYILRSSCNIITQEKVGKSSKFLEILRAEVREK